MNQNQESNTTDRNLSNPPLNESVASGSVGSSPGQIAAEAIRFIRTPLLILLGFAAGIGLLGLAQRSGWIEKAEEQGAGLVSTAVSGATSWICPMMCVPPTDKPGRCPVCGMELVQASSSSNGPSSTIEIDPRARRVAGIRTTPARLEFLSREISAVGEIHYDETRMKTLSAYINGRIEDLKVDFTGIKVQEGELVGLLYSPDLYSAQVEYVKTLEFARKSNVANERVQESNERLTASSRRKLRELGMTEAQVVQLEQDLEPRRTQELFAPISGTVIEKLATTGQYVQQGSPIYRLADLDRVWLMLELFPEDAEAIETGQEVLATTSSLGGRSVAGLVEFIEPTVDPSTRTVGVRVAMDNSKGVLKPGEFARANLQVNVGSRTEESEPVVVIPRNSLLSIGPTSLAYVETKPGLFEIRHLKIGPIMNGKVVVYEGIQAGDNVVAHSTFLVDAQMQLQGNPSLIDPDKAVIESGAGRTLSDAELEEIRMALEPLPPVDREMAETQVICPVTEVHLGSMGMGTPIKLEIDGREVFICCEGCRDSWINEPKKYFQILEDFHSGKLVPPTESTSTEGGTEDLPIMDLPIMDLPTMDLPSMELPEDDVRPTPPDKDLPQMELPH